MSYVTIVHTQSILSLSSGERALPNSHFAEEEPRPFAASAVFLAVSYSHLTPGREGGLYKT